MSNELAPDSRQSVDLKWKLRKALEKNVAPSGDGKGLDFGQDVTVDGKLHLNELSDIVGPTGEALFTNDTQENVSSSIDTILSDYMEFKYAGKTLASGSVKLYLPIPACCSLKKCASWRNAYSCAKIETAWGTNVEEVVFRHPDYVMGDASFIFAGLRTGIELGPFGMDFQNIPFPAGAVLQYMFYSSTAISYVHNMDVSNITTAGFLYGAFGSASNLADFSGCKGWKISFDVSGTALEHDALVELINQLETVTKAETLTMGEAKLALLSDEEKLGATNKGWTLA